MTMTNDSLDIHPQNNILLTPAAIAHVQAWLSKHPGVKGLRLKLITRGCSGLAYEPSLVEQAAEDDLVFPQTEAVKVYIAKKDWPYLKGLTVDYVSQGFNEHFKYYNPNEKGSCGCGESFTV